MVIKKLLSFIIIFSFAFSCFADERDRHYTIDSFSKGLNSHTSIYTVPKTQCHSCQNVRFNESYNSLSKRDVLLLFLDFGDETINGIHRYYRSDATQRLIVATGTYLKTDNSGASITIKAELTDGKRFQFITYKDVAIGVNGYDNALKYDGSVSVTDNTDGHRTAENLCADLGAPFAELNTGANLDASSWYQYKVAFYDGSAYTYNTSRSNAIKTGAAVQDITLTDIPIGPSGTTHRYVYRTLGNASKAAVEADNTFYKIATIADNSTRTIDDDMTDDVADNDAAPTWATVAAGSDSTPPKGAFCRIHKQRLFITGNTTDKSDIYWSDEYNPDWFDPLDYEQIRPDDGDEITFLAEQGGILVVGKTNTIQLYYTDLASEDDWYPSNPFSFVGCPAPYTVADTPLGVFYLARKGLYRYTGQGSQFISDAVTPEINDISQTNIEKCFGFFFKNQYHLAYTSTESGASENDRVLVYDLIRDAYTVDTQNVNCFTALSSGTDFGVLYSGSSIADGKVWAHEASPSTLIVRYKSQFDDGTWDDARVYNTEERPIVELAWDCTIDGWSAELTSKGLGTTIDDMPGIIDRPDTDGTWTSPSYLVNAGVLDKLYWNEELGSYGDVTFQIRTNSTPIMTGIAWSAAFTNPNGDDISGETADTYLQLRANLSTTDIDYTPNLIYADGYVIKTTYFSTSSTYETDMLSSWDSGWKDLGTQGQKAWIQRIKVFYQGTEGTLTFTYKNEEGDVENSFDIDLSIDPPFDADDDGTLDYMGVGDKKVFIHYPPGNTDDQAESIGQLWRFLIDDAKTTTTLDTGWVVDKIETVFWLEERND